MNQYLGFDEDDATAIVHAFIFFAYFSPILGGYLADAWIGKFWTVFFLSIVYCVGQVTVSVTAIPGVTGKPPHWWGLAVGLFLVGLGTGGIKPCVSSFGGTQLLLFYSHVRRSIQFESGHTTNNILCHVLL